MGSPIQISGASCEPTGGGDVSVPPAVWSEQAWLCGSGQPGGGCAGEQICAPEATAGRMVCVYQDGDVTCPDEAQGYSIKHLVYLGIADDRDCEPCGCSDPEDIVCQGTTTLFKDPGCLDSPDQWTVPHDGSTCVSINTVGSMIYHLDSGPTGGSCSPTGGQPSGTAEPTDPVTVCCLPAAGLPD